MKIIQSAIGNLEKDSDTQHEQILKILNHGKEKEVRGPSRRHVCGIDNRLDQNWNIGSNSINSLDTKIARGYRVE